MAALLTAVAGIGLVAQRGFLGSRSFVFMLWCSAYFRVHVGLYFRVHVTPSRSQTVLCISAVPT
eukprot:537807-Amorphochlora_amoeboformis.AAC.1